MLVVVAAVVEDNFFYCCYMLLLEEKIVDATYCSAFCFLFFFFISMQEKTANSFTFPKVLKMDQQGFKMTVSDFFKKIAFSHF